MVVKLGKIVYVFTQHVHTAFEISTPFISQNIHVEMLFFLQKSDRKFTLFWSVNYTSISYRLETWHACVHCYSPRASHGFGYLISDRRFEYQKLLKMVIPCKKSWSAVLLLGELDSLPNYKSPNLLSVYLIECMADFLCVMTL